MRTKQNCMRGYKMNMKIYNKSLKNYEETLIQ